MTSELNLTFRTPYKVSVHFNDKRSEELDFESPFTEEIQKNIRWYLETYAAQYTTPVDDQTAETIIHQLPVWGQALFEAVFKTWEVCHLYEDFLEEKERLLMVNAKQPAILSLPWELLYDPKSTFLCNDNPPISIRRRFATKNRIGKPFTVKPKECLHILFIVSCPSNTGLIEPCTDAKAALAAIDALGEETSGRFEVEFLHPPTLENLTKRLECRAQYCESPSIDIIHFDGHSVFSSIESLDKQVEMVGITKKAETGQLLKGYLLFENQEGEKNLVDVDTLGNLFIQEKIGLIILSTCQSAMMGNDEPTSSVAVRLSHTGIPAVLTMTHSVSVDTTRKLFVAFYESLAYGASVGTALDHARQHLYTHPECAERQRGEQRITPKLYNWFLPTLYQAEQDILLLTTLAGSHIKANSPLREVKTTFIGTRCELREHWRLITTVIAAIDDAEAWEDLEPLLENRKKNGWENLVATIHLILDGERDDNMLCNSLSHLEASIVHVILRGIEEPKILGELLSITPQ